MEETPQDVKECSTETLYPPCQASYSGARRFVILLVLCLASFLDAFSTRSATFLTRFNELTLMLMIAQRNVSHGTHHPQRAPYVQRQGDLARQLLQPHLGIVLAREWTSERYVRRQCVPCFLNRGRFSSS